MSQMEELASQYEQPGDAVVAKTDGRSGLDWAVLVVALALGCNLAWVCLLVWAAVSTFQFLFS